ncbi:MAG: hypothetical protein FJX35_13760 [Alphaproteobacteria bacterium]|nr:hypothetical protein [Alphaproteobacteria bacterium]
MVPGANSSDPKAATGPTQAGNLWKSPEGFGFRDLIDAVNPLQHLPVVGTLYRAVTGDNIGVGSRIVGSTIFGGPIGFASAIFNSLVEADTGKDIGAHALALFDDSKDKPSFAMNRQADAQASASAAVTSYPRLSHRDEQHSPAPASPAVANTGAIAAAGAGATAAHGAPLWTSFPKLSHRDEQTAPAPSWLPPAHIALLNGQPPAPVAAAPAETVQGPASGNSSADIVSFPGLTDGAGNPLRFQVTQAGSDKAAASPGSQPGAPQAAPARTAESVGQLFGQNRAASQQGTPSSRGTTQTFAAGVPGAGIRGMSQPLPPTPLGWNAAAAPTIAKEQLPVAVSPDQVPAVMLQGLQKYDRMLKARTPQGEQVSTLN